MRRNLIILLLLAMLGAGCSASFEETLTVGSSAEPEPGTESTPPVPTNAEDAEPNEMSDPAFEPLPEPENPTDIGVEPPRDPLPFTVLSIEDALLAEADVDAPWEFQYRQVDREPYGIGAQQSDCADFWAVEQVSGLAVGNALWWRDGGNLNHDVIPYEEPQLVDELMDRAEGLAETCPLVSWGEGGSTSVATLDLAFTTSTDVRVVNLVFGTDGDDLRWVSLASRGNLVSVLTLAQWRVGGDYPITEPNTFAMNASTAAQRLAEAGAGELPAPPRPEPTATPTVTSTPIPVPSPPPPTPTVGPQQPPIDDPDVPEDLRDLLLGQDDLPGWEIEGTSSYSESPSPPEVVEACPAFQALEDVDGWFEVERTFEQIGGDEVDVLQLIGRAPSAELARGAVELFAEIGNCNAADVFGGGDVSLDVAIETSLIDIPGADRAVVLSISAPNFGIDGDAIIVAAVGDVVVGIGSDDLEPPGDSNLLDTFAALAATKIAAS